MARAHYGVHREIRDTAEMFYRALSTRNFKTIDALWAHEHYAAVAGPTGQLQQSWDHVRRYWEQRLDQTQDRVVSARITGMVCHAVGDVGWFSGTEHRAIKVDGIEQNERLRVTCVLERQGTNWQMVSYHASVPEETPLAHAS